MATYTKTIWNPGDLITSEKMNKIEDQLELITPSAINNAAVPNLLTNSYFPASQVVNQRGVTAWQDEIGIDRWYSVSAQANITQIGMRLTPECRVYQLIDHSEVYAGKTLTFAAYIYGKGVTVVSAEIPSSLPTKDTLLAKSSELPNVSLTIRCGSRQNIYVNIVNTGTNAWTAIWAALYEGAYTVDTLPTYVQKGYAEELAECQRYYRRSMTAATVGALYNDTGSIVSITFPRMRIDNPTVVVNEIISQGWGDIQISELQAGWGEPYGSETYLNYVMTNTAHAGKTVVVKYEVSADL